MPPPPDARFAAGDAAAAADPLPSPELVGLDALLALDPGARAAVRGVVLEPDDDLAALLPELDHVDVVGVRFPAFTDGRGYSHARRLRATRGWRGELRAIGDVRLDQARSMLRCGFDVLEFADAPDAALLRRSLERFPAPYQSSYPVPPLGAPPDPSSSGPSSGPRPSSGA